MPKQRKSLYNSLLALFLVMELVLSMPYTGLQVQAVSETPTSEEKNNGDTDNPSNSDNGDSVNPSDSDNGDSVNPPAVTDVDKSALEQLITDAKAYTEQKEKYTPASFKTFEDALESAKDVYNNGDATGDQVTQAAETLTNAIKDLVAKSDKTELKNIIDDADTYTPKEADYTSATFEKFKTVLYDARQIYDNDNATNDEVSQAVKKLNDAITELIKRGDKTELKKLIDMAAEKEEAQKKDPDLYTSVSYKTFSNALTNARKVFNAADALQDAVDAAKKKLDDAISTLIYKPRYKLVGNTHYYDLADFFAADPNHLYRKKDNEFFQWALDKAGSDYYTEIYVPAGTYEIYKTLLIHSNTTLRLDPGATIIRKDTTRNMLLTSDSAGKSTTVGGYNLAQNLVITGGTWDGGIRNSSGAVTANTSTNLIYLGHASNITISNTTIHGCNGAHALELAGVENAVVSNCQIYDFARSAANNYFDSEAIQLDACGKDSDGSEWAPGYKADNTACQNITIKDNTITDYPRGVGTHHAVSGHTYDTYKNITIQNNTFNRSSASTQSKCKAAIRLEGIKKATVKNNTVNYYSDYGIYIKNCAELTVKKNTLKYNAVHIYYTGCKGVTNQSIKFTVTQKKLNTKAAKYKCPTMKTGYLKINGKKYTFKKVKTEHTAKLKKKIKKNQKWQFYGKDKNNNKFFYNYTVR